MALADRVRKVVAEQLDVEESRVTEEASFEGDLRADSLMIVEMIMALEDELDIEIPDDDVESIKTFGEVLKYLEERGVGA
jgi:acyl carrier protein